MEGVRGGTVEGVRGGSGGGVRGDSEATAGVDGSPLTLTMT